MALLRLARPQQWSKNVLVLAAPGAAGVLLEGRSIVRTLIAFACFFPIVVNTIQGIAGVDRVLLDTARTFGLTTREIIWKIVLPSASPNIVAGMRIALAIALILTVISELVASNDGIGFMILDMERAFRIPEMYAGIFTLMVVGYLLNRLFVVFESRTLAWYFGQSRRAQE